MQNSLSKVNNFAQIAAFSHSTAVAKHRIHDVEKYVIKSNCEVVIATSEKDHWPQFNAMMPAINKNKQASDCSSN